MIGRFPLWGVGYGRGRSPLSRGAPVCRLLTPTGAAIYIQYGVLQVETKLTRRVDDGRMVIAGR